MVRFKVTDGLGNVSYVHSSPSRGWCCTLSNGIPASMSCAIVGCDEMGLRFKLEDAKSDEDRFELLTKAAPNCKVEMV